MSVHATFRRLRSRAARLLQKQPSIIACPVLCLLGLLAAMPGNASTLNVPGTYASIKAAILNANSGDTILVAPGTYDESIVGDFDISMATGLNITITSSGGPGVTTLDYSTAGEVNVISYQNSGQTTSSVFSGFTIKNDNSPSGAIEIVDCSATVRNCIFSGCKTVSAGGGVSVLNSGSGIGITPTISGCKFVNCQAGNLSTASGFGGAIEAFDEAAGGSTKLIITNCQFTGNVATYDGAAVDVVGASGSPAVTLANCSFNNNVAKGFIDSSFTSILTSPSASATVGAVDVFGGATTLVNCVLWGDAGATVVGGINSNEISTLDPGAVPHNSDIQQSGFSSPNINANPLYINAAGNNLEVPHNSPVINVGVTSFSAPNVVPTTDLNNFTRTSPPDMGAYEYGLTSSGTSPISYTAGAGQTSTVVTFNDTVGNTSTTGLSASISWGDTTSSVGTVVASPGGGAPFSVTGTHTYAIGGVYTITTTVTAATNAPSETTSANTTANVAAAVGVPTANAQVVSVNFNTAKAITLTGSDPDTPPLALTFAVATSPTHGALSGTAPNLTYTPNANFQGPDSFTFTVSNGTHTSSAATVSITVKPGTPTANAQSVSTSFNTAKAITLTGSDPDVPALSLTFTVATSPTHGTLSGTAPNLTYTPTAGYHGSDSFTFTTSNGTNTSSSATVSITVGVGTPTANAQSVNVAFNTATGITLTGSDPDVPALSLTYAVGTGPAHGSLTGTAPNLTYTPNAGYHGSDSFTFTVNNGTNSSAAATVSLTVATGTPTANNQSVSTPLNTAVGVTLTGSDPDVPALPLTYTVASSPTHGALTGTAPNLTYTPNAGYFGPDSFTFTVSNGTHTSASATVSITVTSVAVDVSGQVTVTRGGYRLIPGTTTIAQTVTLTNTGSAITGPISLVLTGLSSNATLSNATGTTSAVAPAGRPYINAAGLAAGASETVGLLFSDPTKAAITYTTQVLAGPGSR